MTRHVHDDEPAVYRVPEELPARIAWALASIYRLRPGDSVVYDPSEEPPLRAVLTYHPNHIRELEGMLPFMAHQGGPEYHEHIRAAPLGVSEGGEKRSRRKRKPRLQIVNEG